MTKLTLIASDYVLVRVQFKGEKRIAKFYVPVSHSIDEICQALSEGLGGIAPPWKAPRTKKKGRK